MGVPPAKLHEKLASWHGIMTEAGVGEVEGAVEKLRLLACLIRSMRALRE
jgi:hypothetical protein